MLINILLVGFGGFIGSVARYLIYLLANRHAGIFPFGTFIVNLLGCFLIGLVSASAEKHFPQYSSTMLFLSTGVLGGFTTFSAFGLETVAMIQDHRPAWATAYAILSLLLGLGAVWLGRLASSIPHRFM